MIKFVVPGAAVGQQRTGRTIMNGRIVSYDPKKSRDFKQLVQMAALGHLPPQLLEGALVVQLDIIKDIPKSFSKKKHLEALSGKLRPTTKPDNTNYAKGIEDALTKMIWRDDAQIVTIIVRKWYGDRPRSIVCIEPYDGGEMPPDDA